MCRRFHLRDTPALHRLLRALNVDLGPLPSRFNIAPTDQIAVVHHFEGQRTISDMRWGLVPHWAPEVDSRYLLFNARVEDMDDSRAYNGALENKRAVVPADSFLEWRRRDKLVDMFDVRGKSEPLAFAAVWDYWTDDVVHLLSCSILTTAASPAYASLRDRMPVLLDTDAAKAWLDPSTTTYTLRALFEPRLPFDLAVTSVDRKIGDARSKNAPQLVDAAQVLSDD